MIVAGVDSSTQSCTVNLFDADSGALLAEGREAHPPTAPPRSEHNPADWWFALGSALNKACDNAGVKPSEIAAVSVAAQYSGLVVLDAAGAVVRPVKLWNDTTSAADAERLIAELGSETWLQQIGCLPTAAQSVSKLAGLRRSDPSDYDRSYRFCSPADWLTYRLTGHLTTDPANASGTGFFEIASGRWSDRILRHVDADRDWAQSLPTILVPGDIVGAASTEAAESVGLSKDTIVSLGTGDQGAAALALGISDGDIAISLGTSGTVYGYMSQPPIDRRHALTITSNALGGYLPIAVLLNAAKVTDTFARLLGVTHDQFTELALSADTRDPLRPILAAFLDGERSPNLPHARGLLAGISSAIDRPQFALSAVEGVALGLLEGYESLLAAGFQDSGRLYVTGGASRSRAYRAAMARFFRRDIWTPRNMIGSDSARGAAIQAVAALREVSVRDVVVEWKPDDELVAEKPIQDEAISDHVRERYRTIATYRGADVDAETN